MNRDETSLQGCADRPLFVADQGVDVSRQPRGFSLGWSLSLAAHLMVLAGLLWLHAAHQLPRDESPVLVDLVDLSTSSPPGPSEMQTAAGATEAITQPVTIQPVTIAPLTIQPIPQHPVEIAAVAVDTPAVDTPVPNTSDLLSDAQLSGAATADDEGMGGGGGGGTGAGSCNMALVLQRALRRDPLVHTAVAEAGRLGKAVMLWNGDWIRSGTQDGKGLSGVRQAILWELAFAPEACRKKQVHGLVLLSFVDGTRFAIGSDGDWRWSDLLGLRQSAMDH